MDPRPFHLPTAPHPRFYVARPATEHALAALLACTVDGGRSALLLGPPGMGKSLLLGVLHERARERLPCLVMPVPNATRDELLRWLGARLDPGGAVRQAEQQKRLALDAAEPQGLLLLVDDAERLLPETARLLAGLADDSEGAIRFVAATRSVPRALEPFADGLEQVSLEEPMDEQESAAYLAARFDAVGAGADVRELFPPEVIHDVHGQARGVPALLNHAANDLLRDHRTGDESGLSAPLDVPIPAPGAAKQTRAHWLWLACCVGLVFALATGLRISLRGGQPEPPVPRAEAPPVLEPAPARVERGPVVAERAPAEPKPEPQAAPGPAPPKPARVAPKPAPTPPRVVAEKPVATRREPTAPKPAAATPAPAPKPKPVPKKAAPLPVTEDTVSVAIRADVRGFVAVDGVQLGPTPQEPSLAPGRHRITVTFPDGTQATRDVEIGPDAPPIEFSAPTPAAPAPAAAP